MIKKISLNTVATIIVFATVCFFLFTNSNGSISRGDEAIHNRVVQEMAFENGTYLSPRFFNNLYLNKPPLQFWLSTPIVKVIGDKNFAYRIIPMLAGLGTCIVLLLFSESLFASTYPGLISILIALGGKQILFDHGMRVGTMDSMLLFLTTLSMFCLWKSLTSEHKKWIVLTGLFVGLACFTKWVAGLVPWMVAAVLLVSDTESRKSIFRNFSFWFLAGLVSVSIPGLFIGIHLIRDYHTTVESLRLNITERLIGQGFHNQQDIWLYFKTAFTSHYGNFALLCFGLVASFFLLEKRTTKFLCIWALLPLVIYSSLNSRLPWYYMPATPALWLLAAASIFKLHGKLQSRPALQTILNCGFAALILTTLYSNARRVIAIDKIALDAATDAIISNGPYDLAIAEISPKVESSLSMSRRYLFYLNRLALKAKHGIYSNTLQDKVGDVFVLPYSKLGEVTLTSFKSFICPESDFKKSSDRTCIFAKKVIPGLTPIGTLIAVGENPVSRLSGIMVYTQAGKKFGTVQGSIGNIAVPVDPLVSRFDQKLSLNAAVIGTESSVSINGQYLGKIIDKKLQTLEFTVPKNLLVGGSNIVSIKNEEQTITNLNWVSLRPVS